MANEYTLPTILIVGSIIAAPFVSCSSHHRYDDRDNYDASEQEERSSSGQKPAQGNDAEASKPLGRYGY